MKDINNHITIIGTGLTGLSLAYFLKDSGLKITLVESRDRDGGRIFTQYSPTHTSIELGATWLGKKHTALFSLLSELSIDVFKQELGRTAIYEAISTSPFQIVDLPPNNDPSFRIKGGSSRLIDTLLSHIGKEGIIRDQVNTIELNEDNVVVKASAHQFISDHVISTLPPYLFQQNIHVNPSLPENLVQLMQQTHTWMGESIKIGLVYEKPFWREGRSSGTIVSNVGPIPEMYDHSNADDSQYALKGFLNGSYFSVSKEERLSMILNQLEKYYGLQVRSFLQYEEKVWSLDPATSRPYHQHVLPHQNNGHSLYRQAYLDNRLFIAGSETADAFPGYMDGAVRSARFVATQLNVNA